MGLLSPGFRVQVPVEVPIYWSVAKWFCNALLMREMRVRSPSLQPEFLRQVLLSSEGGGL